MGRERGYPLGACGFPYDADYEDGSVPLQLPLSCADHRVEARREGCHLREIECVFSDRRSANFRHLSPPDCRSGRARAVKPCAFSAPLGGYGA